MKNNNDNYKSIGFEQINVHDSTLQWLLHYKNIPGAFWLRLPPDESRSNYDKYQDLLCVPLIYKNYIFEFTEIKNNFITVQKDSVFIDVEDSLKVPTFEVVKVKLTNDEAIKLNKTTTVYYTPIVAMQQKTFN
jgi:hypothetical protein